MDSEFFALVMDHDPNLVFVKDENSVILYANRAFLEVFPPQKRAGIIGTTSIDIRLRGEVQRDHVVHRGNSVHEHRL